jgi:hypothetical protein
VIRDELRIRAPLPDAAWRDIEALPAIEALYFMRSSEFDGVHEAVFRREASHMCRALVDAMLPMLGQGAVVPLRIIPSTERMLGSMLALDPRSKTWLVAIRSQFDECDALVQSFIEAWGARLYVALRFAMPVTDNDVDDVREGDPENVIVLRRLPRWAHPEITDAWLASNPDR